MPPRGHTHQSVVAHRRTIITVPSSPPYLFLTPFLFPPLHLLHLYDVVNTPGITSDISHIDTGTIILGIFFLGQQ